MHMEVRALFGRFVWRVVNIDGVTIHPSRDSRINPTLKVCEHNRIAHASLAVSCLACRIYYLYCCSMWRLAEKPVSLKWFFTNHLNTVKVLQAIGRNSRPKTTSPRISSHAR